MLPQTLPTVCISYLGLQELWFIGTWELGETRVTESKSLLSHAALTHNPPFHKWINFCLTSIKGLCLHFCCKGIPDVTLLTGAFWWKFRTDGFSTLIYCWINEISFCFSMLSPVSEVQAQMLGRLFNVLLKLLWICFILNSVYRTG